MAPKASEEPNVRSEQFNWVRDLHKDLAAAKTPEQQRKVLIQYTNDLLARRKHLAGDADALVRLPQWNKCRRSISEEAVEAIEAIAGSKARGGKTCDEICSLLKRLVATWGDERIVHYEWSLLGRAALQALARVAKRFPEWEQFTEVANERLLQRHESARNGGKAIGIGAHCSQDQIKNRNSPLGKADFNHIENADTKSTAANVDAWIKLCPCLAIPDDQSAFWSVTLDKYGLLVPATESAPRTLCKQCESNRGSAASSRATRKRPALDTDTNDLNPMEKRPRDELVVNCDPKSADDVLENGHRGKEDFCQRNGRTQDDGARVAMEQDDCNQAGREDTSRSNGIEQHAEPVLPFNIFNASDNPHCIRCRGLCSLCILPPGCTNGAALKFHRAAHEAAGMKHLHEDEESSPWLRKIHFASRWQKDDKSVTEKDADVWELDEEDLTQRSLRGESFPKPVISKQKFGDSGALSLEGYMDKLRSTYAGNLKIAVHDGVTGTPETLPVDELLQHLEKVIENSKDNTDIDQLSAESNSTTENMHLNALSLPETTKADLPRIASLDRFLLLSKLIDRWKAINCGNNLVGKIAEATPFDIASCLEFNILGCPGAFSGAHRDLIGGTWVRTLFGRKIWWVVDWEKLSDEEREATATQGKTWQPNGTERAILLEPDDVLIMPHERPVVHAVLTLETALMRGGMFWDEKNMESMLEHLKWIATRPNSTNEPAAYQLPAIVETLGEWLTTTGKETESLHKLLGELRDTGCNCKNGEKGKKGKHGKCAKTTCPCMRRNSRCTAFCAGHPSFPPAGRSKGCME
ncbi:Hypothetical predicted protein [Lecanosticta acicola]|uniref:JmjC domain-containing protein n=1 Tax=Lecanosticta acicola TaxID=111012 RepID=A0AAI8Z6B3_9PEZI|nr:Hypothetical predicted protein [Lecanosticta acicola]